MANGSGPLLRGQALINDLATVRALFGDSMVQRFAERLTPDQRATYEAGFLPGRWYDEDIQRRLCELIGESEGDRGAVRLGVAIIRYHVNRRQRFLARIAGPRRLLARSAGLWSYWRDTGRLTIEHQDKHSARVAIEQHPIMASWHYALLYVTCSAYLVWLSGAKQLYFGVDVRDPLKLIVSLEWGITQAPANCPFHIESIAAELPAHL